MPDFKTEPIHVDNIVTDKLYRTEHNLKYGRDYIYDYDAYDQWSGSFGKLVYLKGDDK